MDFYKLDQIARNLMAQRKTHLEREIGSVYDHGKRVATGVIELRKQVCPEEQVSDELLRAAAMFHDLGKGVEPHARYGAALFREALRDELSAREIEACARLIEAHCDRRPQEKAHDLWARLLQDADLLDHIGFYTVWMDINYCAYQETGVSSLLKFYEGYEEREAKHRALLNFPVSIRIYDEKCRWLRAFIKRARMEATGAFAEIPQ